MIMVKRIEAYHPGEVHQVMRITAGILHDYKYLGIKKCENIFRKLQMIHKHGTKYIMTVLPYSLEVTRMLGNVY